MIKEINRIEILEEVCKHVGVSLQEISCYLLKEEQLCIRGSIRTKKEYQVKGNLQIRADVLNKDGKIIYSMEDYQKREVPFLYDSFELNCYNAFDILNEFDLSKSTIRVYPVIRMSKTRGLE